MSKIRLYGDTSGYIDVAAPAAANNSTLDLSTVAKTTELPTLSSLGIANHDGINVDSSGRVTMPYQPSFLLRGSSGYGGGSQGHYTPPINNSDYHNFSSADHDIGNNISNTFSRFTAPVSGLYFIGFEPNLGNNSSGTTTRYMTAQIRKNGAAIARHLQGIISISDGWGTGNSYWHITVSAAIQLNQNDYIEFVVSRSSSSDFDGIIYGETTHAYGYLIG